MENLDSGSPGFIQLVSIITEALMDERTVSLGIIYRDTLKFITSDQIH